MIPALVILSMLIFTLAEVLPGDVGRTVLGPYATPGQVAALDRSLGADQPLPLRYGEWLLGFVTGNWGQSLLLRTAVLPLVADRLFNSALLALLALGIVIPLAVGLGSLAGLRRDSAIDRGVSLVGLALTAVPEFVSGSLLLVGFAVSLRWFPVTSQLTPGTGPLGTLDRLVLPALPLVVVLFGYIARMARAGTAEVLETSYFRTAVLKRMPRRRVLFRHVMPNALLPTISVIGSQVGWLVGGLVVVESLFNYPGVGKLMVDSARGHDLPVLEASVLTVAGIYMLSNLAADIVVGAINPRVRNPR